MVRVSLPAMRRRGWLAALLGLVVLGSVGTLAWWLGDASTVRMSASEASEASEGPPRSPRSAASVDADNEASADPSAQPPSLRDHSTSAAAKQDEPEQARRAALRGQILAAQ